VGSDDGVPIPAEKGGFKKDAAGRIVLSHLDEPTLTRMALATGGGYVRSVAGDMDLDTIYHDQIRGHMEAATIKSGRRQVWADRFQWPLSLAVLMLFILCWLPPCKKPLVVLLPLLALLSVHATAYAGPLQEGYRAYQKGDYPKALKKFIDGQLKDPENPEILYNIGNAYYKNGDFAAAGDHFSQALSKATPELKPKVLYNMGNSAYRQKKLEEAVKDYEAALKLAPHDRQAQENLAFVKKQLQAQQQKQKEQKQEPRNNADQPQKNADQSPQNQPSQQNQKKQDEGKGADQHQNPQTQKQPSARQGAEKQPGQQNQAPQPQQQAQANPSAASQGERHAQQPGDDSAGTQMLNRLKDQPGRAMMPSYGPQQVDKDW
jgi:Ca-activated chloride channel family protein